MKMFIMIFASITMLMSTKSNVYKALSDDIVTNKVIFDGNEGNLYFFTDHEDKPITIEDDDNLLFESFEFEANSYIGRSFQLSFKSKEFKSNVGSSKSVINLTLSKH